ncbi:MAG TPA: AEC family transporter, partial [Elusimicrobiales bacterium]|nr:AEC family transporter [Elusimicrobiales bacterium]
PLGRDLGKVWWIAGLKMICVPAVYMGLALLAGFGGTASKTTFLQMAMPPAVLNYVIAREFGFDADLVSQSIVLCTLLLFPMLFILGPAMKLLP